MNKIIYILGIVALLLAGCYDDKGNYDYKEVNDLTIDFSPKATSENKERFSYDYRYPQPPVDTLEVTYTPIITQLLEIDESQLNYVWEVNYMKDGEDVTDYVPLKELVLKYPPKQATSYRVKFVVTDKTTDVSYYRELNMRTEVPFVRSWFVLNGPKGDRRLAAIEEPDNGDEAFIHQDVYELLYGVRRFQNAERLMYAAEHGRDYIRASSLSVIQPDSVNWMYTFELRENKPSSMLFPKGFSDKLVYGVANSVFRNTILVNQEGKFYHSGMNGFYFTGKANPEVENYEVDKLYMGSNAFVIVWDKRNRKFMYYDMSENGAAYWYGGDMYPENDNGNYARLTLIENAIEEEELKNTEVLWLGQGITTASKEDGALVIAEYKDKKDNSKSYNLYHFEAGKGKSRADEGPVKVRKVELTGLEVEPNSCFATSTAYEDQFFYTRGSKVYWYNVQSNEGVELYDARETIANMQFRVCAPHNDENVKIDNCRLALVVNKTDGTGELHELYLTEGADLEQFFVYKGFQTIQDIAFSATTGKIK